MDAETEKVADKPEKVTVDPSRYGELRKVAAEPVKVATEPGGVNELRNVFEATTFLSQIQQKVEKKVVPLFLLLPIT